MSVSKKGKVSDPTCASISLMLCGEPLRKVLGKIGYDKRTLGYDCTSKIRACYELLASNEFNPTDEDVKTGMDIVKKKAR